MCLAETSGGLGTLTVASSSSLGMAAPSGNGNSGWVCLDIPGLKISNLGALSSVLCSSEIGLAI